MNKQDFFEKIYSNYSSREEQIVSLLRARGFLLGLDDNGFYLSDNAAVEDVEYLSYGMEEYGLGKVTGSRFSNYRNGHKVIEDKSVRLQISNSARISDAIQFFEESGQVGYSC